MITCNVILSVIRKKIMSIVYGNISIIWLTARNRTFMLNNMAREHFSRSYNTCAINKLKTIIIITREKGCEKHTHAWYFKWYFFPYLCFKAKSTTEFSHQYNIYLPCLVFFLFFVHYYLLLDQLRLPKSERLKHSH